MSIMDDDKDLNDRANLLQLEYLYNITLQDLRAVSRFNVEVNLCNPVSTQSAVRAKYDFTKRYQVSKIQDILSDRYKDQEFEFPLYDYEVSEFKTYKFIRRDTEIYNCIKSCIIHANLINNSQELIDFMKNTVWMHRQGDGDYGYLFSIMQCLLRKGRYVF